MNKHPPIHLEIVVPHMNLPLYTAPYEPERVQLRILDQANTPEPEVQSSTHNKHDQTFRLFTFTSVSVGSPLLLRILHHLKRPNGPKHGPTGDTFGIHISFKESGDAPSPPTLQSGLSHVEIIPGDEDTATIYYIDGAEGS